MTDERPVPANGSINIIVACDENRAIGRKGRLPWRIREDWQWFLSCTLGGACVIGRLSYEAMLKGGNINDKRRFFVVSQNAALAGPVSQVFPSAEAAIEAAKASGLPVWICGGPRIYDIAYPIASALYLTRVHAKVEGCDAWLTDWTPYFQDQPTYSRTGKDANFSYTFEVYSHR